MPNPAPASGTSNILYDESCIDASDCVVVGISVNGRYSTGVIESWDGAQWTMDQFPSS
jgi:hypothetical protein